MAKLQHILAIDRKFLQENSIPVGISKFPVEKFLTRTAPYVVLRQRDYLDGISREGVRKLASKINCEITNFIELRRPEAPQMKEEEFNLGEFCGNMEAGVYAVKGYPGYIMVNRSPEKTEVRVGFSDGLPMYPFEAACGDASYKQLLPYTCFKVRGQNRFITYRRNSLVGESRLSGNASVGFGGHIDLIDVTFNEKSVIDLKETILKAHVRELHEEVSFGSFSFDSENEQFDADFCPLEERLIENYFDPEEMFLLINDTSNEVGRLHLGLVRVIEIDEPEITGVGEEELDYLGAMDVDEILQANPESWTALIASYFKSLEEDMQRG